MNKQQVSHLSLAPAAIEVVGLDEVNAIVERELQMLRLEFTAHLPERLRRIDSAWQEIRPGMAAVPTLRTLYRLVHNLTGSSGTFGFSSLSATARVLEHYLRPLVDQDRQLSGDERTEVEMRLHVIARVARECAGGPGGAANPPAARTAA